MARTLFSLLLIVFLGGGAAAQQAWPKSTPQAEGMDPRALAELVDFGANQAMDSLLVVRRGHVVADVYYAPFRTGLKHRVNSVTKSVVGTLIAIALAEGKLRSLDEPVLSFFPDLAPAHLDARKQAITVTHLLNMTSGLEWTEPLGGSSFESVFAMQKSGDWVKFVLDRPMADAPGARFHYNSGVSHLLSAILTKVTGRSARDYAQEKLFGPIGIDDIEWRADPQGVSVGGYGLYLHPQDMARFGELYLRGGMWDGRQVVPADWIARTREASVDMKSRWVPGLRYANQFWLLPEKKAYMAVGFRGQLIVVMPNLDLVAVATGSARFSDEANVWTRPVYRLDALLDLLARATKGLRPAPADPIAQANLLARIRIAESQRARPVVPLSDLARRVSGRTWRFPDNELGLGSILLKFTDGPEAFHDYVMNGRRQAGPIGLDGIWREHPSGPAGVIADKGRWLDDLFVLDHQTLGDDDAVRASFRFDGDQVELSVQSMRPTVKLTGRSED